MKIPRLTISTLAVLVAIVGVNLAVGRALFAVEESLLYGFALMGLALQFGGFRLVRTRGPARAFWVGFLFGGFWASYSLFWVIQHRNDQPPYSPIGRVVLRGWFRYGDLAEEVIKQMPYGTQSLRPANHWLYGGVVTVAFFPPQLVAALASGLLFRQMARCLGVRQETGDGAANVPKPVD